MKDFGAMLRRSIIGLVLAAIALCIAWAVLSTHEPTYQGRRLSQWLDDYNAAGSMAKTGEASKAIRAMGTNCLPFLLANLKHVEPPWKQKLRFTIASHHWSRFLPMAPYYPYGETSVLALNALGSNALPICPDLLKLGLDTNTTWQGSMSLLAIGPPAFSTLAELCHSTNSKIRTEAILMMSLEKSNGNPWFSFGWDTSAANGRTTFILGWAVGGQQIDAMLKFLKEPDADVRRAAAESLGLYVGPAYATDRNATVKALSKALQDDASEVKAAAAKSLKAVDPIAAAQMGIK